MASRAPIECPLCREPPPQDTRLEEHLVDDHTKRKLARFVVSETAAMNEGDISE
ncbi:uncharacterized protein Nmag_0298 [Natrialba magadii ATCC 43099]|uniref:C2H2-type domain-containing protein n=1 Tax=Natrialba magadii (strain ATCC 43099 / DSM 3394 / CCM 3739 / CIP 104546 / IAM 13178 / JCM 8861 / NBRC 102185 / NCIMB 2190 / MS3) TaxID=547559 RepID=D3SX69_NATMM|nr:hypothetical protein [Natrialba magadii]ADD03889.1 uncharacterized protein Nmag_0298 [Natrialba magadii ATCC 43099]ELY33549.1 hypothetical protein C500_01915 [Natrialba magadii ATCC 43099]